MSCHIDLFLQSFSTSLYYIQVHIDGELHSSKKWLGLVHGEEHSYLVNHLWVMELLLSISVHFINFILYQFHNSRHEHLPRPLFFPSSDNQTKIQSIHLAPCLCRMVGSLSRFRFINKQFCKRVRLSLRSVTLWPCLTPELQFLFHLQ